MGVSDQRPFFSLISIPCNCLFTFFFPVYLNPPGDDLSALGCSPLRHYLALFLLLPPLCPLIFSHHLPTYLQRIVVVYRSRALCPLLSLASLIDARPYIYLPVSHAAASCAVLRLFIRRSHLALFPILSLSLSSSYLFSLHLFMAYLFQNHRGIFVLTAVMLANTRLSAEANRRRPSGAT